MKKYSLLMIAAGLSSASAMAQTNVVVYGIVDTSIRYVSSDNAAGNSNIRMDNGAISNSRFGFKGSEDLGDGLKAIFRLEAGFNPDTGSTSDGTRLFNRHAYVGFSGGYGQLTLGRQQTPLFDLMADHFDPLTVGSEADDHKVYYPGSQTIGMRYTGDRGTGLLLTVSSSSAGSVLRSRNGSTWRFVRGP